LKIINKNFLEKYLQDDWILSKLTQITSNQSSILTSDQWLFNDPAKRCVYHHLYCDLVNSKENSKVLDVGGGLCNFSWSFLRHLRYEVVDTCNHDSVEDIDILLKNHEKVNLVRSDWYNFKPTQEYCYIIANDLFPNVDQRLDEFLEKFLPVTKEIRVSLTYYNIRKTYKVSRMDGDEIFYIRPWDGYRLVKTIDQFKDRLDDYNSEKLLLNPPSIFANGRQVCILKFKGDL
tara:strand:- start:13303 stop:13998 length:696 start_codon:yes stop_codon:yes gene_type:complete